MKQVVLLSALALWGVVVWSELRARPTSPLEHHGSASFEAEAIAAAPVATGLAKAPRVVVARAASSQAMDADRTGADHEEAVPLSVDEEELAEDEEMLATDTGPEQRARRAAWADEAQDDVWTQQVAEDVKAQAGLLLSGDLRLHHLSCRETVCRMYLRFADQRDASAFLSAFHGADSHYDYQRLDPQFVGANFPVSAPEYEVLITRPRPEHMRPQAVATRDPVPEPVAEPVPVEANLPNAVGAEAEATVQREPGEVVFAAVPRAPEAR